MGPNFFFSPPHGDNPSTLLHLPGELFISGEAVVKSLACDDLDLYVDDYTLPVPSLEELLATTPPSLEVNHSAPLQAPVELSSAPTCTTWLLAGLALMGLNAYFLRLSPVSSLWSPLRAAIPVLHWVASWWLIPPGWELNLVSLAPLSHRKGSQRRGDWLKYILIGPLYHLLEIRPMRSDYRREI
ncbi:hypothetical protein DSO57_1023586 [Entomophthora muscae]|uniref:Uncharacterized protein n=1 Tax=Entomophthora muscae TaxID=34485 RepID=A0ACC2U0Q8_9FUNG|nr:hypothetical protein DSO57_1023586 [Entomophthora muscae]